MRSSEKDQVRPGIPVLFKILLKYILASGDLSIVRFEEGLPILRRGDATHVTGDVAADVTPAPAQETDLTFGSQSQSQSQPCHGQRPTQLAQAEVKLAKVALDKATRTAQERLQEEAQEVERKKQEVTADANKSKKEARYKASMDKLGRLPAFPRLCRGEECTGIPCREEEPGFPYSHIDNRVVCTEKAHVSIATRAACLMFHQCPKAPPAGPPAGRPKNSGGGTSGARQAPQKRHAGKGTQRQQQQPPGQQQQQQQRDLDHRGVIERSNLELEVARINANARTNGTSYSNVMKGAPFTTQPPPLPPPTAPLTLPQRVPEDDLERRQAVDDLFTLYESHEVQMMKIRDLLRK
jgi:hypothetical protein